MREMLNKPDTADCTMFRNQLDNFSVFAQPAAGGRLMLFQTELIGDEWTKPAPLRGITTADAPADFNYPFMLTDGTTLYFAARGEESLGGYDIYMTRYDADEQAYLEPENIGMPFNSPANDYLFAIDEFYNLGWFATDRGMAPGKVCVYTFIPNATRRIYNEDDTGSERLRRLARITSIAETWSDQAQVAEARKRMEALSAAQSTGKGKRQFTFVLSDRKTCHSESDFQNAEARQMVKTWQEHSNNLQATRQQLAQLRDKYAAANEAQRAQMAAQIRLTETDYEQLLAQVRQIEKSIRAKELGK